MDGHARSKTWQNLRSGYLVVPAIANHRTHAEVPMNSHTMPEGTWPMGLVSNCWRVQLENGVSLGVLIAEAVRRMLTVIELRQGSLGEFESGPNNVPDAGRLANLVREFPMVQFNVAIAGPYLSGSVPRSESLFVAGRDAAMALANGHRPHLRLVDLQTQAEQCLDSSVEAAARGLIELTEAMIEVEGTLSIEHARQPWPWFDSVMTAARRKLGAQCSWLQLCFDPCNLLLTEKTDEVTHIVESVHPEDVSMIHVKQRRDGQVQPDFGAGDLDWPKLLDTLRRRGHSGPVLFEIAPHVDVWTNLENAIACLVAAACGEPARQSRNQT